MLPTTRNYKKTSESITYAPKIEVDPSVGLREEDVENRRRLKLTNRTKKHVSKSYWKIFADNVFNALNIILFVVFALMLVAKLPFIRYFFIIILAANIVIGVIQDVHSRRLTDKLRLMTDPKATVLRNGVTSTIAVEDIVLSDIIILKRGDQIPSDCVVVEGECSVDESMLSGESVPIRKQVGDTLLSCSYLDKGEVKAEVIRVGSANYAEQLQSQAKKFERPKSEIKRSTSVIMAVCGIFAVVLGLGQFLSWLIKELTQGREFVDVITNLDGGLRQTIDGVSASMVAMIPAGMALLTTAALAAGIVQLAKKKMLVQQLYCIEMLARVDVLCLDKTGTLTDGTMQVVECLELGKGNKEEIAEACKAIVCFTHDSNATAAAVKKEFGGESERVAYAVLPFDSATKVSAVTLEEGLTYAMGAFGYLGNSEDESLKAKIVNFASKGYRCLVIGKSHSPIENGELPSGFELIGLLVISDHIKSDARQNIQWFIDNGVDIRIISGDDPVTVAEIARNCGVPDSDLFVSLEGKSPAEVELIATKFKVFGRASPEQKEILVTAFKKQGHKVAMTGDGVNDILALKVADCSIAMANGSDAAKNVAHLVSLESSFSSLPDVVGQGRQVINNLQRTCSLFLNKTFFAVIMTIVFLISALSGGPLYPFSTSNLLVWEVFAIGIPAFFLALQPSKEKISGSFALNIARAAIPSAVANVIGALLPFVVYMINPTLVSHLPANETFAVTVTLSVLIFTINSFVVLFSICLPPNKYRLAVFITMFALGTTLVLGDFFWRNETGHGAIVSIYWEGIAPLFIIFLFLGVFIAAGINFGLQKLIEAFRKYINQGRTQDDH